MANTLNLQHNRAVGFIVWLDWGRAWVVNSSGTLTSRGTGIAAFVNLPTLETINSGLISMSRTQVSFLRLDTNVTRPLLASTWQMNRQTETA